MSQNRVLLKKIESFLKTPSPNRDFLVEHIKEALKNGEDSVALCFRGSYATLYYRCHQLLRICSSQTAIVGEFDFRHSRFTKDYAEKQNLLESYGVDFSKFDKDNKNRRYVRFILDGSGAVTPDCLAKIMNIYKELINDFISPELNEYQYDVPQNIIDGICRKKSKNVEKNRQQQIYAEYFYRTDETFYDIEYTEPRAKEKGVAGRIDLLGIICNGGKYYLELVELKSTLSACDGNAGIDKHETDYINYSKSTCVEERKAEACAAMQLLSDILGKPRIEGLSHEKMDIVIKFIFTDYAKGRGNKYTPREGILKEIK